MDNGHWQYPVSIDFEEWFGFIYRIVEISTGREYIGKKQFKSYTKKRVAGKKNKKSVIKESDWKKYTGSSTHLNAAIAEHSMTNYVFFIESLHATKGSLFYAEVDKHVKENVLRQRLADGITPKFYNRQISGVRFIPPVESINEQSANIANYDVDVNHKLLLENQMTYEKYYGVQRTAKIIASLNQHDFTTNNPVKPPKKHTKAQIEKWKKDERRSHSGEKNGMFGKACHENMTETEKQNWKNNLSASLTGIKRSEETKAKMRLAAKNRKTTKPTVQCPHCDLIGQQGNMKRYHFDNCKHHPDAIQNKK
jgi:hypothetical protein